MADSDPELAAQLLAAFSGPAEKSEPLGELGLESLPQQPPAHEGFLQDALPQQPLQQDQQESISEDLPQDLPQGPLPQQNLIQEPPAPQDPIPQEPAVPQQPLSPQKRERTPEHDQDGGPSQKRVKTAHVDPDPREVDLSAANWDISEMIQNALGSFDEQLNQPHSGTDGGAKEEPNHELTQEKLSALRKVEPKRMKFSSNPYYVMRTMSLPLLGSLAIQMLLALCQQSREETLELIADEESEFRKAYDTLKSAFGHARRIFSETSPLLFPDELDISDSEDRETIRMSNLAVISSNAIAGDRALLADAHENFPTIFAPEEGDFTKDLKPLYLDLKTRALLSSLATAHTLQERSDVLDKFFPPNFDELSRQRHGDSLFQNREELVSEVKIRRQVLLEAILDDEKRGQLNDQYPVNGFLDSLVDYLQSHLTIVIDYAEKYGINIPISEEFEVNEPLEHGDNNDNHAQSSTLLQSSTSKLLDGVPIGEMHDSAGAIESLSDSLGLGKLIQESLQNHTVSVKDEGAENPGDSSALFETCGLTSLIASKLSNGFDNQATNAPDTTTSQYSQHGLPQAANTSMQSHYLAQYNQLAQTPYYSYGQPPPPPPPPQPQGDEKGLPPNQSFPTSVLYERARQAAVAKSSSAARREGIHSTRRAWTPEEEKALMAGLDMVKGPHWSQILGLFGHQGTVSDILKDRTQVQLKDKARNLKLFFLKTNSEMPYYLQCVTGELKTRAPGQAARKEAEEKARQNSEEEQARIQGIMTLAGGLQHNHPPASSPITVQGSPAPTRTTPMAAHANIAPMTPSISAGVQANQHTTLAPATPGIAASVNMSTAAPATSSISAAAPGTPSISTGAQVTPNATTRSSVTPSMGAGDSCLGFDSTSVPPIPSTATTTPVSPVVVKSEPQDQPVSIQPKPTPQSLWSTEPFRAASAVQSTQFPVSRPTEQAGNAQPVPQPRYQLTLPRSQSPTNIHPPESTQSDNTRRPTTAQEPGRVQESAQTLEAPHHSPSKGTQHASHDQDGDFALIAKLQSIDCRIHEQPGQTHQNHEINGSNGHGGNQDNEHHDNHEHSIQHDQNSEITLLQTLQAAIAAAPSA